MKPDVRKNKPIKTAAFFPADKWGCGYYRCMLPSISLCRMGIPAHIMTIDRINLYTIADTLVLQRPADPSMQNLVEEAQSNGIKVIFEIDDNIWDVPEWNNSYPFWTPVRQEFCSNVLRTADAAIASTEYLAEVLRKENDNVTVVPNAVFETINLDLPLHFKGEEEKIIIGWVGSSFHLKDTRIFGKLIPMILEKYPQVDFFMMGESPTKDLSGYLHRIKTLPFVEPIYYHQILSSYTIDIGLAPLVDCEFNRCKSPIKMTEYLYTNTFPICSDVEPYRQLEKECKGSAILLPTNEDSAGLIEDWMDAIDHCIENIEDTREKAAKGRQHIMENYNIECEKMQALYKKAYFLED